MDNTQKPKTKKIVVKISDMSKSYTNEINLENNKEYSIGAGADVEVSIEDQFLSSKHFVIRRIGDEVFVEDCGSKNRLYFQLDCQVEIFHGQTILAGKTLFKLEHEQEETDNANPQP